MSAKATFWAWEQRVKGSKKLVLLCLADCHNASTERCDPSLIYLSEKTGLDKKTIPLAIENLEKIGLLSTIKIKGKSNKYQLNLTQKRVDPKTDLPQKRVDPKTDITPPENGVTPPPKTGYEPKRNLKDNLKDKDKGIDSLNPNSKQEKELDYSSLDLDQPLIKEIVEIRNRSARSKNQKPRPMSQRIINSLSKNLNQAYSMGYTIDEILETWDSRGWLSFDSNWLPDKNTRGNYGASKKIDQPAGGKSLQQRATESEQRIRDYANRINNHGQTLETNDYVIRTPLGNQSGATG